jgi:peptide chain release factor subunit 1
MLTSETLDRIVRFEGHDLPVTSLYAGVDVDPGRRAGLHAQVTSLLDSVDGLTKDASVEHEARMSVRADAQRIREALDAERWRPGTVAIFACSGRDLYEEVALPRRVRDRIMVDSTPYVRPMLAVLDEYHRTCVVVVDKESARFWELYLGDMREVHKIRDRALRKPNYAAGLAEDHVRSRADELTKRHYRNTVQALDEMFRAHRFDLLIVAGHDYEIPAFLDFLPRELRSRIAGTFSIDPSTEPRAEIRKQADAILQRYERDQERQLVSDVFDTLEAGGLAAASPADCLWAGSIAAVQTLLVEENMVQPGVVCDESGWLALSGDTCPLCGKPTRHTPDVLDELAEAVIDEGGSVKHIQDDDRLRDYAVAAFLRFPLPPLPRPEDDT